MTIMRCDTSVFLDRVSQVAGSAAGRQYSFRPAGYRMAYLHVCDLSGVCNVVGSVCYGKCGICCEFGRKNDMEMKAWAAREGTSAEFRVICDKWSKHCVESHNKPKAAERSGNGMYQGAFAFTLTAAPTDGKTEEDMVRAVRKVMAQKSCPVKRYAWYLEYGDVEEKKHPHIHGMYETNTGGVIERKYWKRAWDIWDPTKPLGNGFRGGYHRPVRDDERYETYIAKQKIRGESRDATKDASPPPPPPSPQEEVDQTSPTDA